MNWVAVRRGSTVDDKFLNSHQLSTVKPQLSGLVGTRQHSPDNRGSG